ncbi:MAG: nucleoside triphosphate pyrophosphohydrolase [Deltaproteobacteria bacterium]|nr:nucleoside triphosphate pyrophosphohydrolase [Deltaproteobacteria bacterium]
MEKDPLIKLIAIMERLRQECPWDREQTLSSLIPFIIEEAYEVVGAIESGSYEAVKEEIGDLLLQVIFVCQIAKEDKKFTIEDAIEASTEKMIRRHPHVFADADAKTSDDVLRHWAEIKKKEGKGKKGWLTEAGAAYPALLSAHRISKRAAKAGFDWKDVKEVLGKVDEELAEFKEALSSKDGKRTEEELGDLLFTLVNLSRFVEVNPEEALRKTIGKFISRFHHIEKTIEKRGEELSGTSVEEMERLWQEAKAREKNQTIPEA